MSRVMKRFLSGVLFASVVTAIAGACDSSSTGSFVSGGGSSGSATAACWDFGTCGTCTPQPGCGWCYLPDGTGICSSDPNECAAAGDTWTWDPSGCSAVAQPTVAQPTVGPQADGGTSVTLDAAGLDAAPANDGAVNGDGSTAESGASSVDAGGSSIDASPSSKDAGASTADAGSSSEDAGSDGIDSGDAG
jgi:hypothetical protein